MPDHSLIDDLLDQWEDAQEQGLPLSVDELCREHPQLRDEVARRIAALAKMDRQLDDGQLADDSSALVKYHCDVDALEFHAKGGLGSVFVGDDRKLNRRVAIKFIHRNLAHDPFSRDRFDLEAEVTGRLEHPGVIPLYGVGQSQEGRKFYAMRFIDGDSMDEAIRRYHAQPSGHHNELTVAFRDLLNKFISVCRTIAYAHNRGIVHRDIKPDNVMLGRYGETIVVDWGLASPVVRDERHRLSGEQTLMPKTGGSGSSEGNGAGTPAYMSPEQASELTPTPASDIYSLGATLFKILTGQPAVSGDSLEEIRTKVIEGRIPKATDLRKNTPRPLEAICCKAMELRPQDRYDTALELADDVERFLADESVDAYVEPIVSSWGRWLRKNRGLAIAAFTGLAACLLLAASSSLWLAHAARRESVARHDAERARQLAEDSRQETLGSSALFLAKSIAQEIDVRWRIMELEAASPRLRKTLLEWNEALNEDRSDETQLDALQTWLEKRYIANSSATHTHCWCLYDIRGTQIARVPEAASIGKNFRHRDYFHGEGHDLTPEELAQRGEVRPLAKHVAYVSSVFLGSNTHTLMVTFSVPIWNAPPEDTTRKRIGIISMPVELGDFALGGRALLADTRVDQFNRQAGLVLHHPNLGLQRDSSHLPYLQETDRQRARTLRQDRQTADRLGQFKQNNVFLDFNDPVDGQTCLAAMEPVIIPGRERNLADTGWVVIVTEDE